jgi:hypothetical protein
MLVRTILYILWAFCIFCGHLVYFVAILYILWPFGIFCGHLVYFVAIWYILWPFGIFYGNFVYISRFGMLHQKYLLTLIHSITNQEIGSLSKNILNIKRTLSLANQGKINM